MIFIKMLVISTFLITCTIVAYIDIQKQKIYNETVAVLFVPAIVSFFVFPEISIMSRILGAVSVSGIMLLMCLIVPGAFGGGDIKMMVPVGLFLGVERTLLAGILAVFTGGVWGLVLILGKMRKEKTKVGEVQFAFGPALCLGIAISLFWSI